METAKQHPESKTKPSMGLWIARSAWLITAVYYFYQYMLRSAPSVMMPQLAKAFSLSTTGVASLAGLFYYGYSPFSLVAGVAMDRLGPRKVLPVAAAIVGVGALLFATDSSSIAATGRILQGAGGVFALVGAIYIATKNFPASRVATFVGATQMFGMAGGSAGQLAVGPMIAGGLSWNRFWILMGVLGLVLGMLLFVCLPHEKQTAQSGNFVTTTIESFLIVFKNPQSILCGLISGLLFIPTTIFDMTWGVRYLQEAHSFDYGSAVMRSASVPFGWIIGCPLLGYISDRIGRRRPVIVGSAMILLVCLGWMLFGRRDIFPPYVIGLIAGVASGAAMLPYTVIKEANPPRLSGTATGVVNFLNFTFSALLGPIFAWLLREISGGAVRMEKEHYQMAFAPLLLGVVAAIIFSLLLKETGVASKSSSVEVQEA